MVYRGPSDAALRSQWLSERRRVVATHHPDRGGDTAEFTRLMDEIDREYTARESGLDLDLDMSPPSRWQPARRVLVRSRRAARRGVRRVRGRIPTGFPGAKRYIDL